MKKFLIFLLGIAVAIGGMYLLFNRTPTADTPPINNEQQQPGDNTGDDNTGDDNTGNDNTGDDNTGNDNTGDDNTGNDNTGDDNTGDVTPDDPSNVGGLSTNIIIDFNDAAGVQSYFFNDCYGDQTTNLNVGEVYTFNFVLNPGYEFVSATINGDSIRSFPYSFVAENEFNLSAQVQAKEVNLILDCIDPNIDVTFYDMDGNETTTFIGGQLGILSIDSDPETTRVLHVYSELVDRSNGSFLQELLPYEGPQDMLNHLRFHVPYGDFVIKIDTDYVAETFTPTYHFMDPHFNGNGVKLSDSTGGIISVYELGRVYQLSFETFDRYRVVEVYMNDELIKAYDQPGVQSDVILVTPTGDCEIRIVSVPI